MILRTAPLVRSGALALGLLAGPGPLRGDVAAPDTVTPVQTASAQESVRAQSGQVNASLLAIIDDMELNGLSNAQVSSLAGSSGKLDALNRQDMQKIVDLLKSAAAMPSGSDQQTALLDAYQQQKGVSTELKELALNLSTQMIAEGVVKHVEALILRQSANERRTDALKDSVQPFVKPQPAEKYLLNRVQTEQRALTHDTALLANALYQPSSPHTDMADISDLQNLSAAAEHQTKSAFLSAAVITQDLLKTKLLEILAKWKAKEDADTRLEQARTQVDSLLKDQKALANATNQMPDRGDILSERQGAIDDRAELTHDVASLNAAAGTEMEQAQNAMRANTGALASGTPAASSLPAQTSIVANLTNAAQLLAQDAKDREARQNQPLPDLAKDLHQLKDRIDQAKDAANKPDPALAARVSQLQKDASVIAPRAADHLAAAMAQLQQSQPQSAAAQELAAASQSVQQQMDAVAPAALDYQALAKAGEALNEALQKATDADNSLKDAPHPDAPRVAGDLATAENDVDKIDAEVGKLSPGAHQALQQANGQFKQGGSASAQNHGPEARQQTEGGIKTLEDAAQHLAQAMQHAQAKGMVAAGMGPGRNGAPHPDSNHPENPDQEAPDHDEQLIAGHHELKPEAGQVVGALSPKDRDALLQYEGEKTPPEYAPMVDQYMKNLSDSSPP
jgi:hypothetical protein